MTRLDKMKLRLKIFPELTNRQIEIISLVCEGLSNQEIADKLFICLKAVTFHLSHIYKGIGVKSRFELILWCNGTDDAISSRPLVS